MQLGWRYRTGERVKTGDRVKISKHWAKEHGADSGSVTGLSGFVTVTLTNGSAVDFDMRSLTFVSRSESESQAWGCPSCNGIGVALYEDEYLCALNGGPCSRDS